VYVDNVIIKTREDEGLISHLAETFDNLRKFKMKLNPEKCTFGVPSGKVLVYMVSHHSIEPNPEKVSTITKMKPPDSLHDVQKLMRCMAALSRFISRLDARGLSLNSRNKINSSGLQRHSRPSKTCSFTYQLQAMWSVQLLSLDGGSRTPTTRSSI
jgi:hypothetical protein